MRVKSTRPEQSWRRAQTRDNGGFNTDLAGPAIEDVVNLACQISRDMKRRGWADFA